MRVVLLIIFNTLLKNINTQRNKHLCFPNMMNT